MHQVLENCLYEAIDEMNTARCRERRYPFFQPAMIATGDGGDPWRPAFVRDVSPTGIGLLHGMPLDAGRVKVSIQKLSARPLELNVDIKWCRLVGEEWCLSGGRLLGMSVRQSLFLRLAVFKAECKRRLQQRYPFFQPVTITMAGGERAASGALGRDLSPDGIGLLHGRPLQPGRVALTFPAMTGHTRKVITEIRWCAPAGENLWLSGGRFRRLFLEELQPRDL